GLRNHAQESRGDHRPADLLASAQRLQGHAGLAQRWRTGNGIRTPQPCVPEPDGPGRRRDRQDARGHETQEGETQLFLVPVSVILPRRESPRPRKDTGTRSRGTTGAEETHGAFARAPRSHGVPSPWAFAKLTNDQ